MVAQHNNRRIAIVGGGLAGATLAIKLLREATQPLSIQLVEPAAQLGRGLAYATQEPEHLLNGPALLFSLYPEEPDHFTHWLARQPAYANLPLAEVAQRFAPRWLYGDYVAAEILSAQQNAIPGVTLTHIQARVDDLDVAHDHTASGGVTLALNDGRILHADHAVLALGVFQARPRFDADGSLSAARAYIDDPWDRTRLAALADARDIVLVGASLTMIDTVVSLENAGYRGSYRVLTRHGLTPVARLNVPPADDPFAHGGPPRTLRQLVRALRTSAREISAQGGEWQSLGGALKPYIADWWRQASLADRQRFYRHVRPHWDVFLHRAPPLSAARVAALRANGRLVVEAASVKSLERTSAGKVTVSYRARGSDEVHALITEAVINCTGPDYRWHAASEHRLVRNLFSRGLVKTGPVELGIASQGAYAVVGADGHVKSSLSVLGAALRGTFVEPGTIPDIAQQTSALSARLLAHPHPATEQGQHVRPAETQRGLTPKPALAASATIE